MKEIFRVEELTEDEFARISQPNPPLELQVRYWKAQAFRLESINERYMTLDTENKALSDRLAEFEDELEQTKDFLRLVREERDKFKWFHEVSQRCKSEPGE